MLTIELSSEEEGEEEAEKKKEEDVGEEDHGEITDEDHNEDHSNGDQLTELNDNETKIKKRGMVMQRTASTEKFQAVVRNVRLANRVVRRLQFHTTKSVARAIDGPDEPASARRAKRPGVDLGHFPRVLRMICRKVRNTEQCYLVVELVSPEPERLLQYLVILRTINDEGLKEDMMLGAEVELIDDNPTNLRFCVGIPVKSNVTVTLQDGDGSFMISDTRANLVLKPSSIQSQWAAINYLTGSLQNAIDNDFFEHGKSHQWCSHYAESITNLNEHGVSSWSVSRVRPRPRKSIMELFDKSQRSAEGVSVTKNLLDIPKSPDHTKVQSIGSLDELSKLIVQTIRSVMYSIDLDEASCKSIRVQVEKDMDMSLEHHKEFIEEKILLTLGQMDEPSLIKDYLFLGSEWNACNYEELIENGITHILNVTSEIDSPFESSFKYYRVEVLDIPQANLLKHWETTHQFIKDCRDSQGKVLVHCQMGISRSGSTTISYLMREYGIPLPEALSFVKKQRSCVNPNPGFQKQLEFYQNSIIDNNTDKQTLNKILSSIDVLELKSQDLAAG